MAHEAAQPSGDFEYAAEAVQPAQPSQAGMPKMQPKHPSRPSFAKQWFRMRSRSTPTGPPSRAGTSCIQPKQFSRPSPAKRCVEVAAEAAQSAEPKSHFEHAAEAARSAQPSRADFFFVQFRVFGYCRSEKQTFQFWVFRPRSQPIDETYFLAFRRRGSTTLSESAPNSTKSHVGHFIPFTMTVLRLPSSVCFCGVV